MWNNHDPANTRAQYHEDGHISHINTNILRFWKHILQINQLNQSYPFYYSLNYRLSIKKWSSIRCLRDHNFALFGKYRSSLHTALALALFSQNWALSSSTKCVIFLSLNSFCYLAVMAKAKRQEKEADKEKRYKENEVSPSKYRSPTRYGLFFSLFSHNIDF